ncbi:permease [Xylanibacillus composti]|uniref:Permease n=1 Tax=Xylanibacillus composti TaxID=1572762 RepID=A0A8J4M2P4_9BACL|nr:permease [Xylanibacillus composti]MDT9724743.1 permease [Xylanibacillus composti]GIQ69904.1 permease [Xylanibacillus composti]
MSQSYKNFDLAIYCTAGDLEKITREQLEKDLAFFQKHLKLSKVYIENHRGEIHLSRERLQELKEIFESKGIATAGGITPTLPASYRPGYNRLFGGICYTDEASRKQFQDAVETAAAVFDEVIFDDFFFNNCACDTCLEGKGERTWEEFRLELMTEVSENLIIKPGKAVNPNVKLVIKYPNWIESYQSTGYNTETQPKLFDGIYTGTETRNPYNSQQHIPRYASYSLMRWMENMKPGQNGGGWFDSLDCTYIDYYLEQAYLTVFSKARELTLFCYGLLKDSLYIPPLGFQLDKLDELAPKLGEAVGLRVYQPHHARGEDHLYNYLGGLGIPFEPSPHFPENGEKVLVAADATRDPDILEKIKRHMQAGGEVIMTSGFLEKMEGKGVEQLTTLRTTGKRISVQKYGMDTRICTFDRFAEGAEPVLFPVLEYSTNGTWQMIIGFNSDYNLPVLMYDNYGKGKLYTLTVPDNMADFRKLPQETLNALRRALVGELPCVLEGKNEVGLFVYDNGTVIVESFRTEPERWGIRVPADSEVVRAKTGEPAKRIREEDGAAIYEALLYPSSFEAFQIVKK